MKILVNAVKLFYKRIPYTLFTALCVYAMFYLGQLTFYRFMPPQYFLTPKSANIDSAQVNQPLNLTFCRYARQTYTDAIATRAFYKVKDGKRYTDAEYTFKANYEKGDSCQIISIPPHVHPKESGIYEMQTTVRFAVQFNDYTFFKVVDYNTDKTFRLSDTVQGLQEQIIELQQEIELLKELLRERGVRVPETLTNASTTNGGEVAITSSQPDTAVTDQPTTSAPPDPEAPNNPQTPMNPNSGRPLLNFVEDTSRQAVTGVTQLVDGTLKSIGL